MSTLPLRRSKRTASPQVINGQTDKPEGPVHKKAKNSVTTVDLSESDSSSDECVHQSVVKVQTSKAAFQRAPSPEPDFCSIEKSIFSGVSTLSDSDDSDDCDFEEVSNTVASSSLNRDDDSVDKKEDKTKRTIETTEIGCAPTAKDADQKPSGTAKKTISKLSKPEVKDDCKEETNIRGRGKSTRSSQRKSPPEPKVNVKTKEKHSMKKLKHEEKTESSSSNRCIEGKAAEINKGKKNAVKGNNDCSKLSSLKKQKEIKNDKELTVKKEVPDSVDNLDIAQLLALGEGLGVIVKSPEPSESESDEWEEVNTSDVKKHEVPKEGVQITLDAPEFSWRRKKKHDAQACLQAEMNRAFNRVRRELQLLCHKASVLTWLAHGIFLNRVINNDSVKALALSLVPNDLCTPPKAPGRKYIDQLLKWFAKEFECSEGFPELVDISRSPPLLSVLEQHFSRKFAKSTKELTFMFVTTLRAVGVESRLIISFQPMPLKPQSDELLAINRKSSKLNKGRPSKNDVKEEIGLETERKSEGGSPKKRKGSKEQNSPKAKASNLVKSISKTEEESGLKTGKRKMCKSHQNPAASPSNSFKKGRSTPKVKEGDQKSLSSPPKTRALRRKPSTKTYKEETDSNDDESDEEELQPILSPDKKKSLDKSATERLKAAAAKRLPPRGRSVSKGIAVPGPSKPKRSSSQGSNSDSEFEPTPRALKAKADAGNKISPYFSKSTASESELTDSDFEKPKPKLSTKKGSKKTPTKSQASKQGSSRGKDDDSSKRHPTSSGSDYWVEVYLKDEERWTCIDIPSKKVDSSKGILARATQPVCYVLGFNPDGTIKDVTKRYSPKFSQVTVKQRVSAEWWEKTLKPFKPKHTRREVQEDSEMDLVELDRPMPKSVGECKNHPLYVLKRHLLKFEAIYPPDAPSLGFVRNEAIYARQNVYNLHSREIWIKEAKVVRPGEKPYKIVKARPKYDRLSGKTLTDLPLEVFGPWQVEDYIPPPAVDGIVPRNAYGNVELFKPTMLPKGCVHLQVPGLSRVAKKLRIDCAPAVVGFDYHSGGSHPTFDGFVVCEEHVDVLMDAWNREIDESAKRREEKYEKRVYGNWRRLIRGLLIREQLKYRYDFNGEGQDQDAPGTSQSTVNSDLMKATRIQVENAPLPSLFPKLLAKMKRDKSHQKMPQSKGRKNSGKTVAAKKGPTKNIRRSRKDETSEEETDWDSSTTEEDDTGMVLLSDEDSGSEFEDLKQKK